MKTALPSRSDLFSLSRRARRALDGREVIYLVTSAGFPNFGDELIVEAWLRHLALRRPFARVVVDSPRPGQASLLLRHANRNAVFVDTIWSLSLFASSDEAGPDVDRAAPWVWVADVTSRLGGAPRDAEGVELLLRAGTVHIVGGGYLNNVWSHHVSLVAAVAAVSRATGARAIATGAGLTPGFTGPALDRFRADAAQFEVFDVRDRASGDVLGDAPRTSFTGDDAWLSPRLTIDAPGARTPNDRVVLCAQSDLTDDFAWGGDTGTAALTAFLTATLDAWEVSGSDITVVECIPGHDNTIPHLMGDRLDGAARIPFLSAWRSGIPFGTGAAWLTTRFHPHLLAAAAGDSGVAVIAKPDYYATKHRSLTESGSAWTVVAGDDPIPARPTSRGFSPADAKQNRARKRVLAAGLYPRRVGLR
ncbi:polysaccharide pyruvyl transferase family protein [Gordonia hydrophobica]|uniref:Polysaccharide pyruvyl transferase family protein n=1 Tax=Gordonia hydrophobica TaxID=40516 RepID=A0ABZ2TZ13_9ACTN|nr:polysaccharide pyruvyl transferase family protein [Gordonia hydrophobica]MBM7368962.1 polysaccharide pyruvyl transferase WcaK-like protein [Gordonia hydrophobica]